MHIIIYTKLLNATLLDNRPCFGCFCAKTIIFLFLRPLHAGNLLTWVFALHPNSDWLLQLLFTTKCLLKSEWHWKKLCYMADKISQSCQGGFMHYQKCHMHTITMPQLCRLMRIIFFPCIIFDSLLSYYNFYKIINITKRKLDGKEFVWWSLIYVKAIKKAKKWHKREADQCKWFLHVMLLFSFHLVAYM